MKVKYDYEVGKLYDTVFYIVTRLFENVTIERVYKKVTKTADLEYDMRFYNKLKDICPGISSDLAPFCYCAAEQPAFLIQYMTDNINFDNGTLNNLNALFSDIKSSKEYFVDLHFPKLSKNDRERLRVTKEVDFINSTIRQSEIAEKYQSDFLAFFLTYEYRVQTLLASINTIYHYVDRLHRQNAEFIQSIINQLDDPTVNAKGTILRYFALTEEKQIVYMFSLLNPYGVHYLKRPYHYPFRVGEKFLTTLSFESEYNHLTFESFAKNILSPARAEIFHLFFEYKNLCAGDIIEATQLSRYTVYTHLNDMLYEKIIVHADAKGSVLRYSLNEDYLYKYIEFATKKADVYVDFKRKDELLYYIRPRKRRKDAQD